MPISRPFRTDRPSRSLRRRGFLRGAGGIVVGLPFLESVSTPAQAGGASTTRFVTFMHPQGTIPDLWLPTTTGEDFEMPEVLLPLTALQAKINILSGIDNGITPLIGGSGHGVSSRTLLTSQPKVENVSGDELVTAYGENGPAAGPSIDQVIANRLGPAPYSSIELAIGGGTGTGAHYAGAADPVSFEPDPVAAFDRLFSDFDPEAPSSLQQLRAARGSVLDAVGDSFDELQTRVSADDRQRLQAHAEKIRELELSVGTGPLSCDQPVLDTPDGYDSNSSNDDHVTAPNMIEIAVMALACGLTNVASIAFTAGHTPTFPWLGLDVPGEWGLWHEMVHGARETAVGRPIMIEVFQWYAEQFALLASRMDEIDDGDGTLLDHSVVLWASEFGDGASHSSTNLPFVLAGSGGGAIPTGRHLDYDGHTNGDLFVSILQALGEPDETFGWPGTGDNPLPGFS